MNSLDLRQITFIMSIGTFVLGTITFGIGVFIMISSTMSKEVRTIANQTTKLAQKGIADEVAGLVGNASSLISAMNNLMHTTAGVGFLLTIIGISMMAGSFWLIFQIR